MRLRTFARCLILIAAGTAAAPALAWKPVLDGERFTHKSGMSIQFPAGWRWDRGMTVPGEAAATVDGPSLQVIWVDHRKHKGAFPAIREDATPAMLPQEVAEKLAANLSEVRGSGSVEILANEPAELAGLPAFRLHLAYRSSVDSGSLRYEEIVTGTNTPQGIFLVTYRAPVLHYFARDVEAYERALASFAIAAPPAGAKRR